MVTSEFISTSDKQESSNGKSVTSVVYIGGKKYFKKQLSAENRQDLRHKMAMYKEFDVGRNSDCKYIVKYITINEDENGLYLLTEHVNGLNIADKIKEETQATIRCVPFAYEQTPGVDMVSGKPAKCRVIIARSY